jgi:CRP/FNR family cyclic AMP-dependent transcriptional regulator
MADFKILIVEPDEALAELIGARAKKALESCHVYFAKEGYEASLKLATIKPNVLVTDLELNKGYTGRKLADVVFRDRSLKDVKVIIAGEGGGPESFGAQIAAGQLQVIPKPTPPGVFERALQRAVLAGKASDTGEFQVRSLLAGQFLFREGEAAEHVFLLKTGRLRAVVERDGKTNVLGEIQPGEFVGEMAYIDGEPRAASVEAVLASELIEIPLANIDAIVSSKPAWSKALLKTLSKRLRGANNKKAA